MAIKPAFSGGFVRELAPEAEKIERQAKNILGKVSFYCRNPGEYLLDFPGRDLDPRYGIEYHQPGLSTNPDDSTIEDTQNTLTTQESKSYWIFRFNESTGQDIR